MKILILAFTFLCATSQSLLAAPTHFVACRGQNHRVIFEQWESTLQLKTANGRYQSLHLMISPKAEFTPGKSITYSVAEPDANYIVVRYATGKPDQLAARPVVPTAVDIKDRTGKHTYEAKIPCYSEAYSGRDR